MLQKACIRSALWGKRKVLKLSAELISSGDWFKIWLFPYRGYSLGHRWSLGEVYYLKWISKCTKKIIPKTILTFCARLHKIAWNSRNYSRKPFQCFRKMIQICNDSRIPPKIIQKNILETISIHHSLMIIKKIAWNSRNYSRKPFHCFHKMMQFAIIPESKKNHPRLNSLINFALIKCYQSPKTVTSN